MISKIYLRDAELSDSRLLHSWRNEEAVRMNSFTTDPIPFENHEKWFDKVMQNDTVRIYIMTDDETPVGQIRINEEVKDNITEGEISYSVDACARGKGFGTRIIALCEEKETLLGRISVLTGKVKYSNIASQKAFEKNAFEKNCDDEDFIEYRKVIHAK